MKTLFIISLIHFVCLINSQAQYVEGPRELNERESGNIVAFAKLYGLIRFFHPSDQALGVDWNQFAVEGIRRIETAGDSTELIMELRELFLSVAPAIKIGRIDEVQMDSVSYYHDYPDSKTMRFWYHEGYGES